MLQQYCAISHNFTHSELRRCRMCMVVRQEVRVMVRVSIRIYVMILFCRNIALFSVFYAFHFYIPHSAIPHTHVLLQYAGEYSKYCEVCQSARVAKRARMAGTVPKLTPAVRCPGLTRICTGIDQKSVESMKVEKDEFFIDGEKSAMMMMRRRPLAHRSRVDLWQPERHGCQQGTV